MAEKEKKHLESSNESLVREMLGRPLFIPADEALDACNMKNRQIYRYGNDAIIFSPACNVLAVQDITGSIKFISGRYIEDAWFDDGGSRHEQGFSLLGGIIGGIASGGSAIGQLYGGLNMGGKDYFSCALVIKVFDPIFKKSKEERVYLLNNKKAGSKEVSDFSFDMKQIAQQLQFVANTKSESRDLACAKALKVIYEPIRLKVEEDERKKQEKAEKEKTAVDKSKETEKLVNEELKKCRGIKFVSVLCGLLFAAISVIILISMSSNSKYVTFGDIWLETIIEALCVFFLGWGICLFALQKRARKKIRTKIEETKQA